MNNDYAVFILTHGRPDTVLTDKTIRRNGYTGKIFYIVDNEDKTIDKYIKNYGEEFVKIFNKKEMADKVDEGNNFDNRKVIIHARNACFDIAKNLGITYFIQFDDDYTSFCYRYDTGAKTIKNMDSVFNSMFEFYKNTNIKTICFSQGGDHIGGFIGIKLKRKAMNSFFCSTLRPFQFIGSINEDVNTYVTLGFRGDLFFTFTNIQLTQRQTQTNKGGMTDEYNLYGTYVKSFHSVLMHPSGVKIYMMNTINKRLHHIVKWDNTVPKILNYKIKKI